MQKSLPLLCGSLLLLSVETSAYAEKPRPNVLFIVCDDLNTHVSTSGYPHIKTPAFDELAAEGMTFGRAYCQYPVCGPSRASFLHGLYPQSTGVLDNYADIRQTRPGTVSMPQRFKEAGYWTGSVGRGESLTALGRPTGCTKPLALARVGVRHRVQLRSPCWWVVLTGKMPSPHSINLGRPDTDAPQLGLRYALDQSDPGFHKWLGDKCAVGRN